MDNNQDDDERRWKSEKAKMMARELYLAFDPILVGERNRAKDLCFQLNQTSPSDQKTRQHLIQQIMCGNVNTDDNVWIESPFHVDYGYNLHVGKNFYANHGCTILDCNRIRIGDNCLLAPHVCISAATHPLNAQLRVSGQELTAPITIGKNAWIGANATICPGVTIGDNVVVAAGAVVVKNCGDNNVVLGGVPAKVIKYLDK